MNLEIPIDKETLKKLGESLPKGGIMEITKRVAYAQSYISKFFNGEFTVTEKNKIIIDEAQNIIKEQGERAMEMEKEINQSIKSIK